MRRIGFVIFLSRVTVPVASAAEKKEEFQVIGVMHSTTTDAYIDDRRCWMSTYSQMTSTGICVSGLDDGEVAKYHFWQEVRASDGTLYRLHRTATWAWSSTKVIQDGAIVLARISGNRMYVTAIDRSTGKRETLKFKILQTIPPTDQTK